MPNQTYLTGGAQPLSPNFANFQVLSSPPANPSTGRSYFDTTLGIGVYASGTWNYASGGGGGAVASVFGRIGIVVASNGDYTFAQIASIPTTLAGYTITDGVSLTGTQTLTNKTISGSSNTITNIAESSVTNLTSDLAAKQATITLTTTGTSGAATLIGATLNIPSYTGGGTATEVIWIVAASGGSFPTNGQNTYTNAAIGTAKVVQVFRGRLKEPNFNPGDSSSYYTISSNTITFVGNLSTGELIDIIIFS